MRIYFLYCDILFMKILYKLYMLLVWGIMVILLNNRVEFKIEVVILVVIYWLDKKVVLKYIDLVKMFFIVIS